jgi:uncharacterized protein RhaS with RHS repeats
MGYANSPMDYANPDAVTQIANGLSTTTYSYDNNGNLIQSTTDGTTTTYVYDYANRLTALGVKGATTTYGYDAFGQRVIQTGTTTTTLYPFKWYSIASSTGSGAKYATTTSYVFNGARFSRQSISNWRAVSMSGYVLGKLTSVSVRRRLVRMNDDEITTNRGSASNDPKAAASRAEYGREFDT